MTCALIACLKCGEHLDLSRFHRHARDGYSQPCKACKKRTGDTKTDAQREARRRWKKTAAGRASAKRSDAKQARRPAVAQRRKDYYARNPDKNRERYTKWNEKMAHIKKLAAALTLLSLDALDEIIFTLPTGQNVASGQGTDREKKHGKKFMDALPG